MMKLNSRLLTEGFVWVKTYDDLHQDAEGHLSKLVHLRADQEPISDARTATYVILSHGSGTGGRRSKSIRRDHISPSSPFLLIVPLVHPGGWFEAAQYISLCSFP
jgi:hypothetical protein